MPHSIFDWSYPPGCSGPPEDNYNPSPLVESISLLLEEAGVPESIEHQIQKIIEDWELSREPDFSPQSPDDPNFDERAY